MIASAHTSVIIVIANVIAHSILLEKNIFEPSRPGIGIVDHAMK